MTTYEMIDISASYHGIALSAMMGYFTVVTAYFAAAYTVGASLNRSQVVAVNALFLVMSLLMTCGTVIYFMAAREYRLMSGQIAPPISPAPVAGIIFLIGIIVGLKFMWDIRHPKKN